MDYNLVKLNQLEERADFDDGDLILVEVADPNTKFRSVGIPVELAFTTSNTKISNAGSINIDLDEIRTDHPELPDELKSQDDLNQVFGVILADINEKLTTKPDIILHEGPEPPMIPDTPEGKKQYHNPGTIWIDTTTFRNYLYFVESGVDGTVYRHWVGMTER